MKLEGEFDLESQLAAAGVAAEQAPDCLEAVGQRIDVDVKPARRFRRVVVGVDVAAQGYEEVNAVLGVVTRERAEGLVDEVEVVSGAAASEQDAVDAEMFEDDGSVDDVEDPGRRKGLIGFAHPLLQVGGRRQRRAQGEPDLRTVAQFGRRVTRKGVQVLREPKVALDVVGLSGHEEEEPRAPRHDHPVPEDLGAEQLERRVQARPWVGDLVDPRRRPIASRAPPADVQVGDPAHALGGVAEVCEEPQRVALVVGAVEQLPQQIPLEPVLQLVGRALAKHLQREHRRGVLNRPGVDLVQRSLGVEHRKVAAEVVADGDRSEGRPAFVVRLVHPVPLRLQILRPPCGCERS